MKDKKIKVVLVNMAFIFLPLVFGIILLFSVFAGFIGTWFIFQDWIFSPRNTELNRDVVIKICKMLGLLGGIFLGYLSCFWIVRVFPSPPPYVIWRSRNVSPLDRNYWAQKVGEDMLKIVDNCLAMVREYRSELDTEYGSHLISALDSASHNRIVSFIPTKKFIKVSGKPTEKEAWVKRLQSAEIHIESGPKSRTVLRLVMGDMKKNESLLREFFQSCCEGVKA